MEKARGIMRFRDEAKSGGETRNFVGFEGGPRERERRRMSFRRGSRRNKGRGKGRRERVFAEGELGATDDSY